MQNPYRILGAYANSPKREIVVNKTKASRFVQVGRTVVFPLDLNEFLSPLVRTYDMLKEAEAHLAVAKEQIEYAQFWFLKMTELDDIAFNHLFAGNIDQALAIWAKQDNLSSLQNRMICSFIKCELKHALTYAEQLYVKFGSDYITQIDSSSTLKMSRIELIHLFIDTLKKEIDISTIHKNVLNREWKEYARDCAIKPIINTILAEIGEAKTVDCKNGVLRKEAAQDLIIKTKEPFNQLKKLLSTEDSQFQLIADKLGLEILQCGIDYFNNSNNEYAAKDVLWILKYALSIVAGTSAKQRCEENIKTLQHIIDELPPKEVFNEDKAIKAEVSHFLRLPSTISNAILLLTNTKPFIQRIKDTLGSSDSYYLKLSTQIVRCALNNIIKEFNSFQKSEHDDWMEHPIPTPYNNNPFSTEQRLQKIDALKNLISKAWEATILMDEFDVDHDFESIYLSNRDTLKSLCDKYGIPIKKHTDNHKAEVYSDPSEEEEEQENNYIKILLLVIAVAAIICIVVHSLNLVGPQKPKKVEIVSGTVDDENTLYGKIVNEGDSVLGEIFVNNYPNSSHIDEIVNLYETYEYHHANSIPQQIDYILKYDDNEHTKDIIKKLEIDIERYSADFANENSISVYEVLLNEFIFKYKKIVDNITSSKTAHLRKRILQIQSEGKDRFEKLRQEYLKREEEKKALEEKMLKEEEYSKYGTDANAWKTANSISTIEGYKDYIKRYPNGKHVDEANKRIIDLEVRKIINSGDYGQLPASHKMSYVRSNSSTIHIHNKSDHTITILYSGIKSVKVMLGGFQSKTIILPSSSYDVVATSPDVRPFYGKENLTGGDYESTYKIITTRY